MFLQLLSFHGNRLIVIGGLLILVPHFRWFLADHVVNNILTLVSILSDFWKLLDSNRCFLSCSQIVFNWWFNMFFFELLVVAKWFWCRPGSIEGTLDPGPLNIKCHLQPVLLAYNPNGRVTERRSRQVFPICRPNDFEVVFERNDFDFKKSTVRCWFWSRWSPRGEMSAGDPWCPEGIHVKGSVEIQKHVLHICRFDWHQHSEFAIGLRSLVFWATFK